MIDTHAHISKEYYSDIDNVIERAKGKKIDKIIISGCEKRSISETLEIIKEYDNIYGTIGYHPEECQKILDSDLEDLETIIVNNDKIVGIGEIGLDYYYTKEDKDKQLYIFNQQLSLAEKLKLPVVIHSREAIEDTYNTLKKYKVKGIIHCFSGSLEMAKKYINLGFLLGIGGVITFKNCKLKDVIKELSLENLVLETDCPYLSPVPYRGKTNEPAYLYETAKFIAELKNIDIEEVDKITTENVFRLFDLK